MKFRDVREKFPEPSKDFGNSPLGRAAAEKYKDKQTGDENYDAPIAKDLTSKKEDATPLAQMYDDMKHTIEHPVNAIHHVNNVGTTINHPGSIAWKRKAIRCCDSLKNDCAKHIIIDIYCNALPLDQEYVRGNMGQLTNDIDNMLTSKGMTPSQYMTTAYEKTKAPLLEYVNRAIDLIGKSYMEEADKKLKDAQENNIDIPDPEIPSIDDEDIESQLVDVKDDHEYEHFMDKLKEKTVKQIVNDISALIKGKKEEDDMSFKTSKDNTMVESTTSVCVDYLTAYLMRESVDVDNIMNDDIVGLAIREATLQSINELFKMPATSFREFKTMVNMDHGIVANKKNLSSIMS